MFPLAALGASGSMPLSLSTSTSSDGKQGGNIFGVGDFNAGFRLTKNTTILIGGVAFLVAFVLIARK